jgi:hypothetical protein
LWGRLAAYKLQQQVARHLNAVVTSLSEGWLLATVPGAWRFIVLEMKEAAN